LDVIGKPRADSTNRIPDLYGSCHAGLAQEGCIRKAARQDLRLLAAQQAALALQLFAGELEAF
jgi:hypothetical protein